MTRALPTLAVLAALALLCGPSVAAEPALGVVGVCGLAGAVLWGLCLKGKARRPYWDEARLPYVDSGLSREDLEPVRGSRPGDWARLKEEM